MGSEAEQEGSIIPKLPLLLKPRTQMQSPERPGMLTPPGHSLVSVPFRWEDEPGKPKPCTALSCDFSQKCLELPPRLLIGDAKTITKLPTPNTVLDGPYMGKSRFQTSSFRMSSDCYGSFRGCSPDHDDQTGGGQQLGALILSNRGPKGRGILGSWRRRALKGKREVGGGSYVFPSSVYGESEYSREGEESGSNISNSVIRRAGSFSSPSPARSHFWDGRMEYTCGYYEYTCPSSPDKCLQFSYFRHSFIATICEGLKKVVPWKSKKLKGDGLLS